MNTTDKPDRAEVMEKLKELRMKAQSKASSCLSSGKIAGYESAELEMAILTSALTLLSQDGEDAKDREMLDWLEKQEDIKLSDTMLSPKYEGATWEMGFVIERPNMDDAVSAKPSPLPCQPPQREGKRYEG